MYTNVEMAGLFIIGCLLGWIGTMTVITNIDEEYPLQPTIEVLSQCKQPNKLLITNGKLGVECASGVRFENLLEGE